jgi:hypothetical protein
MKKVIFLFFLSIIIVSCDNTNYDYCNACESKIFGLNSRIRIEEEAFDSLYAWALRGECSHEAYVYLRDEYETNLKELKEKREYYEMEIKKYSKKWEYSEITKKSYNDLK